ncbi:hypothetical protein EYV94_09640 [Puteibacter caeruleilacunae]|nr:hypothetical protein EYV94_09640 [Puteibacter caeruleilacunae]
MKKYIVFIIAVMFFASCEEVLMEKEPKANNLNVFDEYATLIKEKYGMLEFKKVDIDALSANVRASVTNEMSEKELFEKLSQLTLSLRDGHSNLFEAAEKDLTENSFQTSFDILEGYPEAFNMDIMINNYIGKKINPELKVLPDESKESIRAVYGTLPGHADIAYVWIPSWDISFEDAEIEEMFAFFKEKKGLIFDIRQNGGGDPVLATKFASYFITKDTYTGYERFKIGPGAEDFKDSRTILHPAKSDNLFPGKVAVLIDRNVYSASLTFSYSLFPVENVTFVGQRAGGGSGSVADGYLLNGWYWSLSVSEYIDYQGNHLDDGFDPDIAVDLNLEDKTKDEIIERALVHLSAQ